MSAAPTRYDRVVAKVKDHPRAALVLVVGLAVVLLASFADASARLWTYARPPARLEVVSVQETVAKGVDVTLRNLDDNEAVITAISGQLVSIDSFCVAKPIPVSGDYLLPIGVTPGSRTRRNVSHSVPAHGSDRFIISPDPPGPCMKIQFTLEYNRGRKLIFRHRF